MPGRLTEASFCQRFPGGFNVFVKNPLGFSDCQQAFFLLPFLV
jgi:hypothetical protein